MNTTAYKFEQWQKELENLQSNVKKELENIKKNFYWDPEVRNEEDYFIDVN